MSTHGESSSLRLVERIGASIISGELAPGSKLTEASLAAKMGVNRAPLREALLRLEERQLIERVPFSGMRVASVDVRKVIELYEIREVLEGLAIRKAASRITDEEVAGLYRIVEEGAARVEAVLGGDSRTLSTFGGIHTEIARISGNTELQALLGREIWKFLRVAFVRWERSHHRLKLAVQEHRGLVDALAARDGELAELLMRRHSVNARNGMIELGRATTRQD